MEDIITFYELVHDKSEPPEPIIDDGVLLDKTILIVIGEAKAKKSFLAMNFALSISKGSGFAGFTVQNSNKVLLLSAEGGYFPTRERVKVMTREEQDVVLKNIFFRKYVNLSIDDDDDYQTIRRMIEYSKPKVVIFDPLIKFHGQDENSSMAMNIVFKRFRELNNDYGISIIIVHHTGKNISRGGRGSSLITGEYDSAITMKKLGEKSELSFDMRHVETPKPRSIVFNKDTFWFESVDTENHVVEYLKEHGPVSRTEIVNEWVSTDTYQSSHSYRLLKEAIERDLVSEGDDGKLHINENE